MRREKKEEKEERGEKRLLVFIKRFIEKREKGEERERKIY